MTLSLFDEIYMIVNSQFKTFKSDVIVVKFTNLNYINHCILIDMKSCHEVKGNVIFKKRSCYIHKPLAHYQTTIFRLFQNERVCRRQFQI